MNTYKIEWWNGWTNHLRSDRFKLESPVRDWRQLIKARHNMVSVLDIHILSVEEVS